MFFCLTITSRLFGFELKILGNPEVIVKLNIVSDSEFLDHPVVKSPAKNLFKTYSEFRKEFTEMDSIYCRTIISLIDNH